MWRCRLTAKYSRYKRHTQNVSWWEISACNASSAELRATVADVVMYVAWFLGLLFLSHRGKFSGLVVQVVPTLLRSSWQEFNWYVASRGPSAIAELLVKMLRILKTRFAIVENYKCKGINTISYSRKQHGKHGRHKMSIPHFKHKIQNLILPKSEFKTAFVKMRRNEFLRMLTNLKFCLQCFCLQCFDAVGWAAGRASDL